TPPILEAEMALRAEQVNNSKQKRSDSVQSDGGLPSQRHIMTPDSNGQTLSPEPPKQNQQQEKKQEVNGIEERQEPEGRQADATGTEQNGKEVRDVWYEVGPVWFVHKDGFTRATQLKPDEGTPDLPSGRVRVRLETDGSLHDVTEFEVEKCNPSELDVCEDLSDLQCVNESGVLHTLTSRSKASMPLTHSGPNLVSLWPPLQTPSKTLKTRRGECVWDAPPALAALVKRVYLSLVGTRRDHSVCALGRSGTGKTATCQAFTHTLLKRAGAAGPNIMERVSAMFSILRSFGCVSSPHSDTSSRFATVFSLDFNHAGQVSAGHLQTMMLDKWTVCQKSPGESNFLVFSQMLAGLSSEMRTELQLHQLPDSNSFGILHPTKVEEKQRASVAFTKLLAAMETLNFSAGEQKAIWHVLAAIYHLGAAGACKVGRRQFVNFDSAQAASKVLGCEAEELDTAVFKHHLRQLLQKATGVSRERNEAEEGPRLTAAQCVDGMAAGLYEELFTTIVSLINRALSSEQLALASVMVVDAPGLRNPRHSAEERGASWSELCHNYLQERLLEHYHSHTFTHTLERYAQERIHVAFECPDSRSSEVVSAIDQSPAQVRAADGDLRGLLWVLDEEMVTPSSCESAALQRVCQYYSNTVLVPWQNSQFKGVVKAMFSPRISLPRLCRGLAGLEGGSQRALQRNGIIRKTFSGGMAAIRRHSQCIAVKLQADALVNLIRRARPVFLQSVSAKSSSGGLDVSALRVQLHSTQILSALQLYRTGYPEHMTLSDFRCHFQALSPLIMKRYASMFVSHDERKAVEELLVELDVDKNSIVVGASRVFMKRGVLQYLEQQRDQQVTRWLIYLQAACKGHVGRQKYRKLKVRPSPVRCPRAPLKQLEMQLEQEYEEKQMVIHEKHDLEGLIATLCEQVGHRDFDVERKLRRDLKRTHALLADAQLLLATLDSSGQGRPNGSKDQIERLHCQLEESEARRLEAENTQKAVAMELDNAQLELENICRQKSVVDEQLLLLQHEKMDLLKRLEEDQEDLNELMKKHKALIAQSSSDISQIRELQAELEEVKKQRRSLQEELQQCVSRMQFLESSTVGRSIVSKQEARVCDLENKLEFKRGQVKRFEVLVLRLRDSVVRLGEELEQSAQAEAREKEHAGYYQQRLQEMKLEMDELSQREQDSSRRRMELEMQVEELSTVRQTLQADLETSIRRIVDLQAALEEVESSDESETESVQTAVESFTRKKDLDSVSSVGSVGSKDVGEGIRSRRGGSPFSSQDGRQSVTDTMSTYSFRSCLDPDDEGSEAGGVGGAGGARHLSRAPSSSALSELLDGLRKRRASTEVADGAGSAVSLPIYQTTGASTLRRRSSALSLGPADVQELRPGPGILKPPSPLLPRAASSRSVADSEKLPRFNLSGSASSLPSLPRLSSLSSSLASHEPLHSAAAPFQRSPQPLRRCMLESVAAATDGGEGSLVSEPMVFQNRRLTGGCDDAASDILPAIRRAQSTSSLASSIRGTRRALSVHFGELPPSTRSRKSSETESSSSGGSGGSSQGSGPRRRLERPQGQRLEAEGSEGGDVASVMKKYLRKEVD
uniref:Myosin motor domain-containing protein n=1 Tax=Xiphophorus couchianus TaxID=32473 RepID=A0A3B5MPJ2_9TELE